MVSNPAPRNLRRVRAQAASAAIATEMIVDSEATSTELPSQTRKRAENQLLDTASGWAVGPEDRLALADLGRRLERGDQHPVEREQVRTP